MVNDITERVNAEAALRESELRFRTVFETNPDAVLVTRLSDAKILSVNDYCLKMSGYTREEMLGKTTLELGLWASPGERDNYMELVREYGAVENFEMKLITKPGRERIGLASARILILNDEQCLLNVVRDITEMKEAEARMMRSELRFRSLVSVLGEGIIILGFNGEIVQCNQAAERIMKMKAEDIVGMYHDELFNGAVREGGALLPTAESPSMKTLQNGKPVVNQVVGLPGSDGQVVWVQMNTYALGLGEAGKPLAVAVSFADVTSLKTIEEELRNNENHLQTLSRQFQGVLEAIPDRILILDRDMRVVWLNWAEENVDLSSNLLVQDLRCYELAGVECGPSVKSDSPLCDSCPVRKTFDTGRTETVQIEQADGRTLALRTFPVFNEDKEVVNVIEIAQDISEELRRQSNAMRTGQLAALGELAAGVAHEINNPINGVINYAQLILNKAIADSREQELSKRIIKESERIATIVRELLYFAREESEEIARITITAALDEALALMQHRMNKEGITLRMQIPENLPEIESRSHQVQRLFLNLINNARYALVEKYPDADPDKVLAITAETVQKDQQQMVRVVFRDQGVGIPEDLLERVVNPFVTTKPSGEGTGLGLSISHEIVQKHKGTLTIESVDGEYTEVIVELPAT
jgi:PAS domain S-box-containing protein